MKKLAVVLTVLLLVSVAAGVSAAPQPPITAKGQVDGPAVRLPVPLTPGTLWANGSWDDINGLASELNTAVSDARTADDFELDCGCPLYDITQIRASHMNSSVPPNAQVELYQDSGGNGPGTLIGTYAMTSSALLGYSQYGWEIIEYTYNTPGLQLPCGHYWLSSIGLGDGTYGDRSFFATAGNGVVQLQEGYFLSNYFGYTTWTPGTTVYGYYSDYAFDIDGSCAGAEEPVTCGEITYGSKLDPYGRIVVLWRVPAWDQASLPVTGVTVTANLASPRHAGTRVSLTQGAYGIARFLWGAGLGVEGTFSINVTDMALDGYTFVWGPECNAAHDFFLP